MNKTDPLKKFKSIIEELKQEKNIINSILDNAKILIFILKKDGTIIEFNKFAEEITGFNKNDIIGRKCNEVLISESSAEFINKMLENIDKENIPESFENRILCEDGNRIDVLWNCSVISDSKGNKYILSMGMDITKNNESKEKLRKIENQVYRAAYYDHVTDLPNRMFFINRFSEELINAKENNKKGAIFYVDLDNFKRVNDSLGHASGDELLKRITKNMKEALDEHITIARLGGDEFIVLQPDIDNSEQIRNTANKILDIFKNTWIINMNEVVTTASIGIALYPQDGFDVDTLMKNADMAMYKAKESGKNSYRFFEKAIHDDMIEKINLEEKLRHAIKNDEFEVYYQPQIDIKTKKIISLEALVRWNDPEIGIVSPGEFIPLAEETRLIIPMGEIILRKACRQIKKFQEISECPLSVAVNISPIQLQEDTFIKTVEGILEETKLNPEFLELEITESILMESVDKAIKTLEKLKEMGIKIALDDFGTGYSSLNYLKSLPIHTLKIDKSFIDDLREHGNDKEIVGITIKLAHKLKLDVVAEGVETEEQSEFLEGQKCNRVQGYLFSRPLPVCEIEEKIKKTVA